MVPNWTIFPIFFTPATLSEKCVHNGIRDKPIFFTPATLSEECVHNGIRDKPIFFTPAILSEKFVYNDIRDKRILSTPAHCQKSSFMKILRTRKYSPRQHTVRKIHSRVRAHTMYTNDNI